MDFRLDDEQLELQDTVRRFCAARFPAERIAERDGQPLDRTAWRELAELGVFALLDAGADGDLGLGSSRRRSSSSSSAPILVSGPVALVDARRAVRRRRRRRAIASSAAIEAGRSERRAADRRARRRDRHAAGAPLRRRVRRATRSDLPSVRRRSSRSIRSRRSGAATRFRRHPGRRCARRRRAAPGRARCSAPRCCSGSPTPRSTSSRRYALEREQFGVPIGSFQALQHMMADMYVRTALARSATYAAAAVLDDPEVGDADRASARGEAPRRRGGRCENARAAIQVLGGMGFTWEMLPNYLLKRAWVLEHAFGRRRLARARDQRLASRRTSHDATAAAEGVSIERRRRPAHHARPAAHKNSLDTAAVRRSSPRSRPRPPTTRCARSLLARAGPDFCSGADLVAANPAGDATPHGKPPAPHRAPGPPPDRAARTTIQLPVVCAVRGWAAGLGFQLALAADFTIAAETASFWEPFVERGFTPTAAPPGCSPASSAWRGPRSCCCSAGSSPARRPRRGG